MPFTKDYAHKVLNTAMGKATGLSTKNTIYFLLGRVPVDENNDPVFDDSLPAMGFAELSATTDGVSNGYARVLAARRLTSTSGGTTTSTVDTAFLHIGEAADRAIQNDLQINWTKAVLDWERCNAFAISDSPTVGETDGIYFVGGLDLSAEDKAAGGLLVAEKNVALFDPETWRIEFPAEDVAVE